MKLGIMQPYFIPYIGYWQLMKAVDTYVIYDDVNFIKGGWINRNKILNNGKEQFFNIPMQGASPNKLIREVEVNNTPALINKNLRILEAAYKKAPYYQDIMPLMESILMCGEATLPTYIYRSFEILNQYMGITTTLIMSSNLSKDNTLKGQDKVIAICLELGAAEYHNAIGGKNLYSHEDFARAGIQLKFVRPKPIYYEQFGNAFVPNLSIVDMLMFNSLDKIHEFLNAYTIE